MANTRKARARRQTYTKPNYQAWLIGIAVVALITASIGYNVIRAANLPGERFASQGNLHIPEGSPLPNYNSNPPTSGPHYAGTARAGSYDHELPDPLLVHNLEDGYVVMHYRQGTPEENQQHIRLLEDAARGYRRVVIVPRSDMQHTYALAAWTRLDAFDDFEEARVRQFLEAFEGTDNHR